MAPLWEQDAYWALLLALLAVSFFTVWFFYPSFKESSTPRSTIESARKPHLSGVTTTSSSRRPLPMSSQVRRALTGTSTNGTPPWDASPIGAQSPITHLSGPHQALHRQPILVLRAWKKMRTNSMLMLLVLRTLMRQKLTTCSRIIRQGMGPRSAV